MIGLKSLNESDEGLLDISGIISFSMFSKQAEADKDGLDFENEK